MRSIQRSLIIYFLLLLTLGLGVVGVLADRVSSRALMEKEQAAAEAIGLRAEERIRDEREKFDRELLAHARVVGKTANNEYIAQANIESRKFQFVINGPLLGLIPMPGMMTGPVGAISPAVWFAVSAPGRRNPGPLFYPAMRAYFSSLKLDELFLKQLDEDDRSQEFIQFNSSANSVRRSANLGNYTLPFEPAKFGLSLGDHFHDDVNLPGGSVGRRVVFRTVLPFLTSNFARAAGPPGPPNRMNSPPPDPLPGVYIHVARPIAELTETIAKIQYDETEQKDSLSADTARTQSAVRITLATTGVATFAALLVGGPILIRRGMTPLHTLTNAVRGVTEKDFSLPVEKDELSQELLPIHQHLTQTLDQLKHAFDREKQAVADISHELRTPVAALLTTLDVALRKPRSAEQYKQTLGECRVITKQLGQLVERVMTLAYIDAGQTTVAKVRVDARELVERCVSIIRPLAESQGLQFQVHAEYGIELETDADKLREVLTNLLHNAIEYNSPGGCVELFVEQILPNTVRFDVVDKGIGMTPDVVSRVFERFYRADASRTATGVHAGLGLAIVKEYVAQLGGKIHVESEPEKGSRFRVELPTGIVEITPNDRVRDESVRAS